ncbi:hypothetical protein QFC19_002784 [Naganishia cerealis]|uniref:Uncharacterized protein n=1 Tax=Naganishia cerealis TaxID=610337 RepID=A0ACC2W5W4_9TREE|nr:hypothetical protein QFC19_002784 [Naganishia cerealis]
MEGSFTPALDIARNTSARVCLMYAFRVDRKGITWVALNHEHWASFISPPETTTHYIGYTNNGLPHGAGFMAYVNGYSYTRDWCQGKRDGNGILMRDVGRASTPLMSGMKEAHVPGDDRILFEGLWIEDKKAQEGKLFGFDHDQNVAMVGYVVPVELTIYRGSSNPSHCNILIQNGGLVPHT